MISISMEPFGAELENSSCALIDHFRTCTHGYLNTIVLPAGYDMQSYTVPSHTHAHTLARAQ
jgi:hypothetical protein